MKKFNNKGFALVETLIVSAFVMGIFTLLFTNFYPMMGEYEKRENYDDIDSVYKTYFIKRVIEKYGYQGPIVNNDGVLFNCAYLKSSGSSDPYSYCMDTITKLNVYRVYLTPYVITDFKNKVNNNDQDFVEYVKYLPNFKNNNTNLKNRIIVEYDVVVNNESGSGKKIIHRFSTIGVDIHG